MTAGTHLQEGEMTTTVRGGDDPAVTELIGQVAEAADAWMRGDIDRYLDLTHHAPGFTLTAPNGGPAVQFADRRSEFEGWQSPFADGEAKLEITTVHHWDDTAVLVMIERQHGRMADLPDQDLSMRVTQVYRRSSNGWEPVHRHADPLTRPLSMAQMRSFADEYALQAGPNRDCATLMGAATAPAQTGRPERRDRQALECKPPA
jgi:ketosteroid isomerase-like protein